MSSRTIVLAFATIVVLVPAAAFAQATGGSPEHARKHHASMFVRVVHPLNPQPLPPRRTPLSRTAQ